MHIESLQLVISSCMCNPFIKHVYLDDLLCNIMLFLFLQIIYIYIVQFIILLFYYTHSGYIMFIYVLLREVDNLLANRAIL